MALLLLTSTAACDRRESTPQEPAPSEADFQVKRLRDDTEIELQDLRGRWLAAEGLLTVQHNDIKALREQLTGRSAEIDDRLGRIETGLGTLQAEIEALRGSVHRPPPRDTVLERLARSYEEVHCLRRQGAEEAVAAVYRRYGFADVDEWAEAWQQAARSEAFEREVSTRVERLCP